MNLELKTELTTLRGMLTYRLVELRAQIQAAQHAQREVDVSERGVSDRKDEAEAEREGAVDEAQEALAFAEMREVAAALHRLDMGHYGACSACGDSIPFDRLLANPAVARCASCQEAVERGTA